MASSTLRCAPAPEALEESFVWIRADTFTALLFGVGAFLWLFFASHLTHPGDFWPGWGVSLALLALISSSGALKRHNYRLAAWMFTGSLMTGTSVFLMTPEEQTLVPFLYSPVVLVAGTLLGSGSAIITAVLASVAIEAASPIAGTVIPYGTTLGALGLIWLTALTSWAMTRNLYTALHWAWANSEQAESRLAEARLYQGRLAAANRQLEDANYRLERANYALTWARAEAEEARRLKAQLAAHVSHELRTPINLIVGFTELMLDDPDTYGGSPLPRAYLTDLTAVHRSARHLKALIDDILDLSQIDAGAMPVLREITDVGAAVHEAVATARELLERKSLSITVAVAPDLPLLYLDRVRIRQVILNLLNNAARFTERGGVSVRTYREGKHVIVEVADTGVGIRPEALGKLFEPFHQLESPPTRSRGGTGLGLAISKRFVELHGGRIWASSEGIPGQGSTFTFSLPIKLEDALLRDDPPVAGAGLRPVAVTASSPAVVVLDDDPAIVNLFQRHLDGYRAVGAKDPAEALALAAELRAHAIVTDAPESDQGVGWLEGWTRIAGESGLRVLCCPMPSGRRVARTLGLVDHLVKPVSRERLLESVETVAPQARAILVVDDDPQMVRLLCRMLESSDRRYQLFRAGDGEQALEMMRQHVPDLVLLDLLMPQVDGLTLLEKMRHEPALASLPVIAVSARGVVEAITPSPGRTLTLVSDDVLPASQLLRCVQTVLDLLPPAGVPRRSSGREPPGGLAASEAS
ncbi:MAG: hybrid sensor histidine kinase/response regulator [Chloroflexi bacterium]|nr:hybrid sensor histidine kinase/response regulator [Chloroflexota bacterium]